MKRSISAFVAMMAIGLAQTLSVYAQSLGKYKTVKLAEMADQMGIAQQIDSLNTGLYCGLMYFEGHSLSIKKRAGRVEHIGLSVFPELIRLSQPSPVYDFIERYALDIMLSGLSSVETSDRLRLDRVTFEKGDLGVLPSFFADTALTLSIVNYAERAYSVEWKKDEVIECRMFFPSNYELLHGSKMLENEERLKLDIICHDTIVDKPIIPKFGILVEKDSLYVLDNGCNSIEAMRNWRFYRRKDYADVDSLELVCSSRYPLESLANLFTGNDIENDFEVEIRQLKYHFKKDNYKVKLSQLIGFCLDEGCLPYFGLLSYDEESGDIEAVVEMRNHDQAYEHMMRVRMNRQALDSRKGLINATLTGYIMTHDIEELYNEKK